MSIEQRVRDVVDAVVERLRQHNDAQARSLTADLLRVVSDEQRRWRDQLETAAAEARVDAERAFELRIPQVRADVLRELESRVAAAMPPPLPSAREGHLDAVSRLLAAVRRIDDARSLTAIFEALAHGVSAGTSRVAILVV